MPPAKHWTKCAPPSKRWGPPKVNLQIEALPADVLSLSSEARAGLSGSDGGGLPLVQRLDQIPRPIDHLTLLDRQNLGRALKKGLARLDIPGRAETSINLLETEGTAAVITGQQPGLVGGPLYTLYKAMQACRLSHELSSHWGQPVVPLFWNHGDDHDWAEVNHAWLLNANHDLQKVGLAGAGSSRLAVAQVPLTEEQHQLRAMGASLRQAFGDAAHVEWALKLLLPRPGETLPQALTRALTQLLGEHGLVVIEPEWIREALSRNLAKVVGMDPRAALTAASDPAINPATAALCFRVTSEGRRALRPGGEGFLEDGREGSHRPSELSALILQNPAEWSPGALLRPIVQDMTLPVAATIGGYGEYAYHRQLVPARQALNLPQPPFVPRIGFTMVDEETRQALEQHGVTAQEVIGQKGHWQPTQTRIDEPPILAQLEALETAQAKQLLDLREPISALEPALASSLKRTANLVAKEIARLTRKARRVHQNQSGKGERHVRRLNHALMPREKTQERVLTPLQFLAPLGPDWVESLYAKMPALSTDHFLVHLPKVSAPNPTP